VGLLHISTRWEQLGQGLNGQSPHEGFGEAVALSSDGLTAVVGAPKFDLGYSSGFGTDSGRAKVFSYNAERDQWDQRGQTLTGTSHGGLFGEAVSLNFDGSMLVIGASEHEASYYADRRGYARIYQFDELSQKWLQASEDIIGGVNKLELGEDCAMSGTGRTVVFGANSVSFTPHETAVHAPLFKLEPANAMWTHFGPNIGSYSEIDYFSEHVDLSENGKVVATCEPFWLSGVARVFRVDETTGAWTLIGKRLDDRQDDIDRGFGRDLSLSADGNVIGVAMNTGARVFALDSVRTLSVQENSELSLTVSGSDDSDPEGLVFSLEGDDSALVQLLPDGVLRFVDIPDFENPLDAGFDNVYDLSVVVVDIHGASARQRLEIIVEDELVEAPDVALHSELIRVPLVAGGQPMLAFQLTATNKGTRSSPNISIRQQTPFPTSVEETSVRVSKGAFVDRDWNLSLEVGEIASLTFTLQAEEEVDAFPVEFVTTEVHPDDAPDNNSVSFTMPVIGGGDVGVDNASPVYDVQTGQFVDWVTVLNNGQSAIPAFRIFVSGLPEGVALVNAFGTTDQGGYLLHNTPLESGESAVLEVRFSSDNPNITVAPVYRIEVLPSSEVVPANGRSVQLVGVSGLQSGDRLIEIVAIPDKTYALEYSSNLKDWTRVLPSITASENRLQWIDDGASGGSVHPRESQARYYRVIEVDSSE